MLLLRKEVQVYGKRIYGRKLIYLLSYSMEQSPSGEANRFSVCQEIPRILCNPNIHYRSHKFPPPVRILRQLDPVHTPTPYYLKIHFNIILLIPWLLL